MPQSLVSVIVLLSWLALPVALVCIVDDWFLRPRRLIAAAAPPQDSPLMTFLYSALPVLIGCALLRRALPARIRRRSPSPARSTTHAASFPSRSWCCCCARSCSSPSVFLRI